MDLFLSLNLLGQAAARHPAYNFFLILAAIVCLAFVALVFLTSKGDAMQSGGSVRTSFKGRATFDDQISRVTLGLGVAFMVLMIVLDYLSARV